MIEPDRFIARSTDRDAWLSARAEGVTATMVAKAATPAGFRDVIESIDNPTDIVPNAVMAWGTYREPFIAQIVKERFGIMPNDWLIAYDNGLRRWQMATPDGLSMDHTLIGEYKTSGKPLDKIPIGYMRQMQWQMYVAGEQVERCLFAYELRMEGPEGFVPGFDVVTQWVDRDNKMISELVQISEQVQQHIVYRSWDEREQLENEMEN
jgi:predicted phage-related endonuclease